MGSQKKTDMAWRLNNNKLFANTLSSPTPLFAEVKWFLPTHRTHPRPSKTKTPGRRRDAAVSEPSMRKPKVATGITGDSDSHTQLQERGQNTSGKSQVEI